MHLINLFPDALSPLLLQSCAFYLVYCQLLYLYTYRPVNRDLPAVVWSVTYAHKSILKRHVYFNLRSGYFNASPLCLFPKNNIFNNKYKERGVHINIRAVHLLPLFIFRSNNIFKNKDITSRCISTCDQYISTVDLCLFSKMQYFQQKGRQCQ
jgi:hypothetical protein